MTEIECADLGPTPEEIYAQRVLDDLSWDILHAATIVLHTHASGDVILEITIQNGTLNSYFWPVNQTHVVKLRDGRFSLSVKSESAWKSIEWTPPKGMLKEICDLSHVISTVLRAHAEKYPDGQFTRFLDDLRVA